MSTFFRAVYCEWLKRRRSFASWMVLVGGFFTPLVVVVARLMYPERLVKVYSAPDFWQQLWVNSWESMAIFFLPMGAVLATSLVTQLEFKNNAWKLVNTLPLSRATVYFSKLLVIVAMMGQFFVLFNVGIFLSAVIPWGVSDGLPFPAQAIPIQTFMVQNALYFVDCLPIVAIQYMVSLQFKNFMVPIGVGFVAWVGALAALPWKFGFIIPYIYCMLNYLKQGVTSKAVIPAFNFHLLALGYFAVATLVGYWLFATRRERG